MPDPAATEALTASVESTLREFVAAAVDALGADLISVILFGSAAEGRLRAASDVNVMVVLERFTPAHIDTLREPLRIARAAIDLRPMFLLASELPAAAEAFAVKFEDIKHRHRVLFGPDAVADVRIPRAAAITRLRQVLLNQLLRLRARYVETSLREEQLAIVLAEVAGPLRAAAGTLLELQGRPAPSPREALQRAAASTGVTGWEQALAHLSLARETRLLPPGVAAKAMLTLLEVTAVLRDRAAELAP